MNTAKHIRKTFIKIAQRKQRPGTGSTLGFLTRRTLWMQFPDPTPILSPIQWAVIGAAATRLYMPERATQDFDIAVVAENGAEVRRKLTEADFKYEGELSVGGSSWTSPDGYHIVVVERSEAWFAQAIAEAQENRDEQGFPVLPFEYLVLMKFQAGRVQDLADITRMLGQANDEKLASVRAIFERLLPEEMEDLESLIKLGRLEISSSQED